MFSDEYSLYYRPRLRKIRKRARPFIESSPATSTKKAKVDEKCKNCPCKAAFFDFIKEYEDYLSYMLAFK